MRRFEASRLIERPPAEVFALVADGVQLHRLAGEPEGAALRRTVEAEHVEGPATGEGSVFEVRERLGGRDMAAVRYETTEFEPNTRVAHRSDSGFDLVFELEEQGGGTLLACAREYPDQLAAKALDEETVRPLLDQELTRVALEFEDQPFDDEFRGCRASTTVPRPPSATFAFLADGANLAQWMDGEVVQLSGPRTGIDARYRLTQSRKEETEFSTVEYEPDRRVAFRFANFFDMVFTVEPADGGSVIVLGRRPVPRPRGLRGRIYARSAFTPERMLPDIERELAAVERALA